MRTSHSALETFRQCPQKYKFEALDKIRQPKSKEAVFGTLIHSSLKYLFSRDPLYPSLDEVIAHFRTAWTSTELLEMPEEEKNAHLVQGESMLRRFYAKNQPWNFNVVDTESRFEITIDDEKNNEVHTLVGIMDRIDKPTDTTYEIIDYKTARKMKSKEALDEDLQLSIYHLGLIRRWPHIDPKAVTLSLYYVKHNEKLITTRTPEQTEHTKERILTTIRDIEAHTTSGDFPPQPSVLCDWCGYKAMCPAWKFLYQSEERKVKNEKEIEEIIKEYFELKNLSRETTKHVAELQKDIKEYMNQENITRVFGEFGSISKTAQERFSYDYAGLKNVLEKHNRLDVWEALQSPDDKKIKIALASLPSPLKEQVLEIRTAKNFETLTISTKKLADDL